MNYYGRVMARDSTVHDYYRFFLAPGLQHCYGGNGAYPDSSFDALVKWVEHGIAPDTLNATSLPTRVGSKINRPLCPYPQRQYHKTCDTEDGVCFFCR